MQVKINVHFASVLRVLIPFSDISGVFTSTYNVDSDDDLKSDDSDEEIKQLSRLMTLHYLLGFWLSKLTDNRTTLQALFNIIRDSHSCISFTVTFPMFQI